MDIISLVEFGKSQKEIGEILGINQVTVSKRLRRLGYSYPEKIKLFCTNCQIPLVTHGSQLFCSKNCEYIHKHKVDLEKLEKGEIASIGRIRWNLRRMFNACVVCLNTEWLGEPITLEVDHIDGDSLNNKLSNLRLVCPNCHSQTPTYKAKNRGSGRHARKVRYMQGKSY